MIKPSIIRKRRHRAHEISCKSSTCPSLLLARSRLLFLLQSTSSLRCCLSLLCFFSFFKCSANLNQGSVSHLHSLLAKAQALQFLQSLTNLNQPHFVFERLVQRGSKKPSRTCNSSTLPCTDLHTTGWSEVFANHSATALQVEIPPVSSTNCASGSVHRSPCLNSASPTTPSHAMIQGFVELATLLSNAPVKTLFLRVEPST